MKRIYRFDWKNNKHPMKNLFLSIGFLIVATFCIHGQTVTFDKMQPQISLNHKTRITSPDEGLWSVSTGWSNDWMTNWAHANPTKIEQSGEWTILSGKLVFQEGELLMRDSYRILDNGLLKCIRRFEWKGSDTLRHVTLSIRFQMKGNQLKPLIPGVLYYGNKMGAQVNPDIIPVYTGQKEEFAIFEDHRYPMPFVMLENSQEKYASAIHTTPSPVRGALLHDQWWSLGIEAKEGYTEFVLYSGPIGYNKQHSIAKAR